MFKIHHSLSIYEYEGKRYAEALEERDRKWKGEKDGNV